ncbi:MAG: rane protein [Rariglobus sp.]|jgi:putative membrane protein|nr:rane protein [Rariglobus sp.]
MDRRLRWFFALLAPVIVWSWIAPHDRLTWWLEAGPVGVAAVVMIALRKRFPLSTLLLVLAWLHCVVLLVGAHYTYARVPAFDWLRELTDGTRNNYDKLGHFIQGFVPAILTREILLRTSPLGGPGDGRPSRWLGFLVVSVCLAFSAFYELVEWAVAETSGEAAESFLGTQGYVWDTQSDMALALIGAVSALVILFRIHDRSLAKVLAARGGIGQSGHSP